MVHSSQSTIGTKDWRYTMRYKEKGRAKPLRAALLSLLMFACVIGAALIYHPDSMLPAEWNPTKPLSVTDDVSPLTGWKLRNVARQPDLCFAVLSDYASIERRPPITSSTEGCFIENPVSLVQVGPAQMSGVQTNCITALRLAMWEHHVVQPAAKRQLGTFVTGISDVGSYSCRAIRTTAGNASRLSSHATASAIDISGFQLADGKSIRLINDWQDSDDIAAFLRAVRNGACDWFPLTLSPDYNELHADHFHLQVTGWRLCR